MRNRTSALVRTERIVRLESGADAPRIWTISLRKIHRRAGTRHPSEGVTYVPGLFCHPRSRPHAGVGRRPNSKTREESSHCIFDGTNIRALLERCINIAPEICRHLRPRFADYKYSVFAFRAHKVTRFEYHVIPWCCLPARSATGEHVIFSKKKNSSGTPDASFLNLV
jgi:hypothetical protein